LPRLRPPDVRLRLNQQRAALTRSTAKRIGDHSRVALAPMASPQRGASDDVALTQPDGAAARQAR
jgi:hypothetical protein